jgi:hypothetical protein
MTLAATARVVITGSMSLYRVIQASSLADFCQTGGMIGARSDGAARYSCGPAERLPILTFVGASVTIG